MQQAIAGAATLLEGVDEAEVKERVASMCEEMAYIEAMRRALAKGITTMKEKLLHMPPGEIPMSQQETVKQVQSLARQGFKEIMGRFDEVDIRLDDMLAILRDIPTVVAGMRRQRDWLFRTNRAWAPVFTDWSNAPKHFDEFLLKVIERSYLFLAPRFMSYREWTLVDARIKQSAVKAKVW